MGISKSISLLSAAVLSTAVGITSVTLAQEPTKTPIVRGEPIPSAESASRLPALVIRPSVRNAKELNDCIVEMRASTLSKDEVTLKIMVPDSVSMIEVVPNKDSESSRNFRVRVDQNESNNQKAVRVADHKPIQVGSQRREVKHPPKVQTSSRFTKNPFFPTASKPVRNHKVAPPTKIVSSKEVIRAEKVVLTSNSAPALPKQIQNATYSVEEVSQPELEPVSSSTSFNGPAQIVLGEIADFDLTIPASLSSEHITVELGVTDGLEIVVVDRKVTVDQLNRTINWHLDVDQSAPVKIRYRAKANEEGYFLQEAKIKLDGKVVETIELGSVVKPGVDDSDAPLLPFED